MKFELKSIGYWSVIKISFVVNLVVGALIGFVIGTFFTLFGALLSELGSMGGSQMPLFEEFGAGGGIVMILVSIFLYGFMGAVFNTILCIIATFVYNLAAKVLGGFEFEFKEIPTPMPAYAYNQQPPAQPAQPASPLPPPPPSQPTPPPPPPPVQPLPPDVKPPEDKTE